MKVVAVSDTHRKDEEFVHVMEKEAPCDMIIHAGDSIGSEDYFEMVAGMPIMMVQGNCDSYSMEPSEQTFYIDRYKTFLTHGHLYDVHRTGNGMVARARSLNCRLIFFGHTHIPGIEWIPDGKESVWIPDDEKGKTRKESWDSHGEVLSEGILLMNPGSLGRPRQKGHRPSYLVVTVGKKGELKAKIKYL